LQLAPARRIGVVAKATVVQPPLEAVEAGINVGALAFIKAVAAIAGLQLRQPLIIAAQLLRLGG
jgi:hypothetical protein